MSKYQLRKARNSIWQLLKSVQLTIVPGLWRAQKRGVWGLNDIRSRKFKKRQNWGCGRWKGEVDCPCVLEVSNLVVAHQTN